MKKENQAISVGQFTEGSVRENIFRMAWPMMVAQLVGVLYNLVDRMFIGHLPEIGGVALTGLGVVFPLITLWNAFANWAGQGGASVFAIERGRGDEREAKAIQGNACFLLLFFSALMMLTAYNFESTLLRWFGASDVTYPYASAYMRIYLSGTPFQLFSLGMNPYINAQGFGKISMLSIVIGAVVNIILDPIFIYVFGLGVAGAAWATVIAQFCSALWVLLFLSGKHASIRLSLPSLKPVKKVITRILVLGFANFVFQMTNSLTQGVSNSTLLAYGGDVQVGVMTVINSLRQVSGLPLTGFMNGAKPVLSFNYGAKKHDRVIKGIWVIVAFSVCITALTTLLVWVFPKQLLGIFTSDRIYIAEGVWPFRIYFIFFIFMTFHLVGQTVFTALSLPKEATFFSLLRKVFLILPLTILLPRIPGMGVMGVYWAEAFSQLIAGFACFGTMWFRVGKKLQQGLDVRD